MRFEHDGISLWYGTPDAPAPGESVQAGSQVAITVGVAPADASNRLAVTYRVNRASDQPAAIRWLRSAPAGRAQYFEARLGSFEAGDTVQYSVSCACAGRVVPSGADLRQASSSFRVTANGTNGKSGAPGVSAEASKALPERSSSAVAGPARVRAASSSGPDPARDERSVATREQKAGEGKPSEPAAVTTPARPRDCAPVRVGSFRVSGEVRHADGAPQAGVVVGAFDKGVRDILDVPLAEAITDECGRYQLRYGSDRFHRPGQTCVDLVVRASSRGGATLAESPVIFAAGPVETVDLITGGGEYREPSEYERHLTAVTPFLVDGDGRTISLADLTESDKDHEITLLARKAKVGAIHVVFLVLAVRHANATGVGPEVYYGLFRQSLPTNLPALLLQRPRVLRTALERSLAEQVIPGALRDRLDEVLASLQALIGKHVLAANGNGSFLLRDLLQTVGVPPGSQESLVKQALQHEGTPEQFWQDLRRDARFQGGVADDIEFAFQAALLTRDNVPLVKALHGLRKKGTVRTSRDLVKLSPADWEAMVSSAGNGKGPAIPPAVPGKTEQERTKNYVHLVTETLKEAFPTACMALGMAQEPALDRAMLRKLLDQNPTFDPRSRLPERFNWDGVKAGDRERAQAVLEAFRRELRMFPDLGDHRQALTAGKNGNPIRADLTRFFANAGEFEFRDLHIDTYVKENPGVLDGVQERARTIAQLKRLQRVSLVAPRWEHVEALMGAGFHSAFAIASSPPKSFLREMGLRLGGEDVAWRVLNGAQYKSAHVMNLKTGLQNAYNGPHVAAIGGDKAQAIKEVPTLAKLFGSADLCECEHCRSVYGPAAYFVDLMQFLRKSGETPFQQLTARRPDLPHIKLSCENSNTPLPYVDLVNEILERYVYAGHHLVVATANNTEKITAEELSVNPQYMLEQAYDALKEAVHSFLLPFDRPLEVARAYLEHLGTSRHEVMGAFQSHGTAVDPADPDGDVDPDSKDPTDLAVALESLKISLDEYEILVHPTAAYAAREFFGYPDTTESSWRQDLAQVPEFLRRTGVDYPDVVELIRTRYVNPGQTPNNDPLPPTTIVLYSPDSACDLSQTRLRHIPVPPDPTTLVSHLKVHVTEDLASWEWLRLHRFLRLWKKLGWRMQDLDQAIHALGAADIDRPLIEKVARIQWLRSELHLPVVELLGLWGPIDTFDPLREGRALYDRLFLNRAVIHVGPTATGDSVFARDATDWSLLSDLTVRLSDHTAAILAALRLSADDLALLREATQLSAEDAPLTLENLSGLYRHALLARALKLKVRDLLGLMVLMGVDPAQPGTPADTVRFVARVRDVMASGFTMASLNYLVRQVSEAGKSMGLSTDIIIPMLRQLQENLGKVLDQTALAPDPTGDLLRQELGLALDATLVDKAMEIIEGNSTMASGEQKTFVDQNLASFLPTLADGTVVLPGQDQGAGARRDYVYPRLLSYLRDFLSRSLVKQMVSDALKLDGAMVAFLLEDGLSSQVDATKRAMADFLALVGDGASAQYFLGKDLVGPPVLSRTDPTISFYWADGSPDVAAIPPGSAFSARWTGWLVAQHDEDYTFYVRAKDGVRLWVGDLPDAVIAQWIDQDKPVEQISKIVPLKAGQVYPITLEHYANGVSGTVELSWSSLSTPKAVVPQSQLYSGPTFVPLEGLLRTYELLHKAALLVNGFRMTAEEAKYLSSHGADFGGFDFNSSPLEGDAPEAVAAAAPGRFKTWEQLLAFFSLRNSLPKGNTSLLDILGASSTPDAQAQLADLAGWDVAEVESLAAALGFPDASFKSAAGPSRLLAAFQLGRRLGISVLKLQTWATLAPTNEQAREIIHTVKAKYDDEQWLSVAKPLNDGLREKQKAALIVYILAEDSIVQRGIIDANQLFEHFLIDVQMSACMVTSRLKQAISSVQLFIQRCFLNLEKEVAPDVLDENRWKWMRNYRLWEANRKVFLYPENWIEPDLRDDKTPFFRDLETQLLQDELTDMTVEQALMGYLEKLDEVARLEIIGVHRHQESGKDWTDVVHIFGRTPNKPHVYYYRQFIVTTGVWTPWEKISLDIDGDHLISVVWNRRLYLFWATFEDKPDPEKTEDLGVPNILGTDAEHDDWLKNKAAQDKWAGREEEWEKADEVFDWFRGDLLKAMDVTLEQTAYFEVVDQPESEFNKQLGAEPNAEHQAKGHDEWLQKKALYDHQQGAKEEWQRAHDWFQSFLETLKEDADKEVPWDYSFAVGPPPQPTDPGPEPKPKPEAKAPVTRWEIKLSWAEYRQNRWSPKQTAKSALISGLHTSDNGGEGLLQTPRKHTFWASITDGGALEIYCYRKTMESPLDVRQDSVWAVGLFRLGGCGDKATAVQLNGNGTTAVPTPDTSEVAFMRFDQLPFGDSLTLFGPPPAIKDFEILRNSPSWYEVVRPADRIAPEPDPWFHITVSNGGLSGAIYPFGYQDAQRTYLALPVVDRIPKTAPNVLQSRAAVWTRMPADDVEVSKIKEMERAAPTPVAPLVKSKAGSPEIGRAQILGG